eukprot:4014027-Pleurochrysis_carterae.AAC.2
MSENGRPGNLEGESEGGADDEQKKRPENTQGLSRVCEGPRKAARNDRSRRPAALIPQPELDRISAHQPA